MARPFSPALMADEIEVVLPQYGAVTEFAEGGQGAVFKAEGTSGPVAIKVFSPDQLVVRAEREVAKLRELDSPHVVKLVESGFVTVRRQKCFYSVTRFEQGEDLRRRLSRAGRLPEFSVRSLLRDLATAIDQLWSVRVVHCDIKPANILFGQDGVFKLVDLGLAKHLDLETVTQAGVALGTPGYMAPEQMLGRRNFTLRVDLFALGVVAYESLTGLHPFGRDQIGMATGRVIPRPLREFREVAPEIERVIMSLIRLNPLSRPASGTAVKTMLGGDA